jgi:hypothetical protein
LLCTLGVSPQAFYNETAEDLACFLRHICAPPDVLLNFRMPRTPEAEYLGTSQVQDVFLYMKACFTTLASGGTSVDTWSPDRAFNPVLEDSNLVAFLVMAGLTVTDDGLLEEERRKEEQGERAEAERKMLTQRTEKVRAAAARKSAEEQIGGKNIDGNAKPGPQKKRPSVQLSVEKEESAGKKARNEDGSACMKYDSNNRPTTPSGQANGTTVGGTENENTAKESVSGLNENAGSETMDLQPRVKLELEGEECKVVNHPNPWYCAFLTRRVEDANAKMAATLQAQYKGEVDRLQIAVQEMAAERDEALRGQLQLAEEAKHEMGIEWLGKNLVGTHWRFAREEKGLFSESRELPRNRPFCALSSKRLLSELNFFLAKGIESEHGGLVNPPFDRVEVVIKQSAIAAGGEGLFCGEACIKEGKLIGVYGGAELTLGPFFQADSISDDRYQEAKQKVIEVVGAGEFNERLPYMFHHETRAADARGGYSHHFVWGDPHYGSALGKINSCREKSCPCNVQASQKACKLCARRQNAWWDLVEDVGKILVFSTRAIKPGEEIIADYPYSNAP